MSDIAIRVENLGKMYRIGVNAPKPQNRWQAAKQTILSPFEYLNRMRRPPTEEETLWALRDVSFEVKRGEVMGVIGRNGAGKSTLLKILSRITEPTHGWAEIHGRVGSLLEVGTGFHPELTGRENVYLSGTILGMKKAEIDRKFDEIVDFSGVEKFIDTPVKRYSSGMNVRLGFAVAAHLEPEILLVDEVLAVGDAAFQKKCLGKMGDVAKEGRTVLFVSHNMAAVRKLCSRGILLTDGEKALESSTDDVVSQYLTYESVELSPIVNLPDITQSPIGRAMRLRFFGQDGTPRAQFRLGEFWRVIVEFEIYEPVQHVIAGIGLTTYDSVGLVTYWSQPQDLKSGLYQVEFVCDVLLKSCDLQISVGLSENERAFYYNAGAGHISISDVATGEQPLRASGAGLLLGNQNAKIVSI